MATSGSSPRYLPGEDDIALQDRHLPITQNELQPHLSNDTEHPKPPDHPPPYTATVPPPAYNTLRAPSSGSPLSQNKQSKWLRHRRTWIIVAVVLTVMIAAIALGRALSNRTNSSDQWYDSRNNDKNKTKKYDPTSIASAKVFGLASAECEQGTFVVWKLEQGEFWFSGQLLEGEWVRGDGGRMEAMKVPVEGMGRWDWAEVPMGQLSITAVCFRGSIDDTVNFSFIYYHPNRSFRQIIIQIHYLTPISNLTRFEYDTYYETIPGVPFNSVSLASTYISFPNPIAGHHLFYTVPSSSTNTTSPATIIQRTNSMGRWGGPSNLDLNITTLNAESGLAAASIDGRDSNDNATSIHLTFYDLNGRIVVVNWTEAEQWSTPTPLFTASSLPIKPPTVPFTLCLPSSNHTDFQLTPTSSFRTTPDSQLYQTPLTQSTQYFLAWISPSEGTVEYVHIAATALTGQGLISPVRSISLSPSIRWGNITSVRAPPLISCSARRYVEPVKGSKRDTEFWGAALNSTDGRDANATFRNGNGDLFLSMEGVRESIRWSERVQLFYVEAMSGEGRTVRNLTWRRDRSIEGPRWSLGDVIGDVGYASSNYGGV